MDRALSASRQEEQAGRDAALVARIRAGEEQAFAELVRQHAARMQAVARRLMKNEHDARDAVQDAFLSVHRALDTFDEKARLSTWLHRIVVNACLTKLRGRRRRPEAPIEDLLPTFLEDGHHAVPVQAWPERVDALLERAELRRMVRGHIDRLPEAYRTVLVLRDLEELSTEEAAQLLEITPNAVKVRLHRARLALRTLLDPEVRGRFSGEEGVS